MNEKACCATGDGMYSVLEENRKLLSEIENIANSLEELVLGPVPVSNDAAGCASGQPIGMMDDIGRQCRQMKRILDVLGNLKGRMSC